MKEKAIDSPDDKIKEILDDIMENEPVEFVFMGRKRKVGWMTNYCIRKFTHVSMKEKDELKKAVKICTILLLNNLWKIRFFYWIYWRYLYYVCDIDMVEVLKVVDVCKKKIPSSACSMVSILVTGMTDVMMTMTKREAELIRAEQAGGRHSD